MQQIRKVNIYVIGKMGVGETGVGKMGQIIGKMGAGKMGVGETGTSQKLNILLKTFSSKTLIVSI